jgi:hypothetical protein
MTEELVITPDITRFKRDGLNFVVKRPVEGKEDTWWVLQTSLAGIGNWPKTKRRNTTKWTEMSGDLIRQYHADYHADETINRMATPKE